MRYGIVLMSVLFLLPLIAVGEDNSPLTIQEAAIHGDLAAVRKYLEIGVDVNVKARMFREQ